MTIVSPMGQLRPVFADKNGKRLSGGKVFTYEPGTLTPKATYTDALNLIPNTNPINLDESGEADIYLDGGYRMQVFDRYGVLIQDVDNFRTWASGIPAESILYGNQDLKQFNADVESSLNNRYTKEETYSKSEVDTSLNLKANSTDVDTSLSLKADKSDTYTKTEVDTTFAAYVGGRKAYTTLALAQAAQSSLPANTAIEVTNDPDAAKNGTYQWNGTTLTKSAYDPETIVRTKVLNTFKTKALMDASALLDGADAQVTDDTVNNGLYVKTAGVWVKSKYSPVEIQFLNSVIDFADAVVNGGAGVGDIYYNKNAKAFYQIDRIDNTDEGLGNANPISFGSHTVFNYDGIMYKYTGGDLVTTEKSSTGKKVYVVKSLLSFKDAVVNGGAKVGDYYIVNGSQLYRITRIDDYSAGTGFASNTNVDASEILVFYQHEWYSYSQSHYVFGPINDRKIIVLTGMVDLADTIKNQNGQIGDLYYHAVAKRTYKITEITDRVAGTGSAVEVTKERNALYKFKDDVLTYRLDGSIVSILDNDRLNNFYRIYSVIDFKDAVINGGAGIGDVYYNGNAKTLYQIDQLNETPVGTGHANPIYNPDKGRIYICQGELYFWDDTVLKPLVNKDDENNSSGTNLSERLPYENMFAYVNGLKFADELQNPITTLTKPTDNFGHTSSFVFHNDICYATFMVNTRGSGEVPSEMTIRMATFDVASPSNVTHYDICDIGHTVLGKTVTLIYDAAIFLKDGIVHILWNAQLAGDNFYSLLHQTFDPSTSTFSDIAISQFKVNNTVVDLTGDGINIALMTEGVRAPTFSQHIVLMTKASQRVESGTTYYYSAIGSATGLNMVVKTADFMTWEYVAQPSFNNKSQYEPAAYVMGDYVYYYSRQTLDSSFGFLTKYHIPSNVWADPVYISETQSRSQFHVHNGVLYLIYAPRDRHHLGIIEINTKYLEQSKLVQLAKVSGLFMYPEIEEYGGQLYMIFSDGGQSVKVSNFTLKSISESSIDNTFKQLFNI